MLFFKRSQNRIAIVKVEGVIADADVYGGSRARVIHALRVAERKRVKGIVLRVNSPGGTVASCQEILDAVVRLKDKGIPVIASMGDIAASGGVYIAMAATEIIANPGTVTGSIGVIIRGSNFDGLYEKIGISAKVVKSGPHKDMLSTYRAFTEEEMALLQGVIDDSHKQFVEVIASNRKKSISEVEQIADGRIMTGRQAVEVGLVDALGGLELAIDRASFHAGIKGKPKVLRLELRKSLLQRLMGPFTNLSQSPGFRGGLSGIPLWLLPTA